MIRFTLQTMVIVLPTKTSSQVSWIWPLIIMHFPDSIILCHTPPDVNYFNSLCFCSSPLHSGAPASATHEAQPQNNKWFLYKYNYQCFLKLGKAEELWLSESLQRCSVLECVLQMVRKVPEPDLTMICTLCLHVCAHNMYTKMYVTAPMLEPTLPSCRCHPVSESISKVSFQGRLKIKTLHKGSQLTTTPVLAAPQILTIQLMTLTSSWFQTKRWVIASWPLTPQLGPCSAA